MSLSDAIANVTELLKDGADLFKDFTDGDNTVDLGPVADDLTTILREQFKLPIPEGFAIKSVVFEQK